MGRNMAFAVARQICRTDDTENTDLHRLFFFDYGKHEKHGNLTQLDGCCANEKRPISFG